MNNKPNFGSRMREIMDIQVVQELKSDRVNKECIPNDVALDLTKGGKLATITLADKHYTLRITKSAKLILTK